MFPKSEEELKLGNHPTIDGGASPRIVNSAIRWEELYAEDIPHFNKEIDKIRAFWERVNNTDMNLDRHDYENLLVHYSNIIDYVGHFRIQFLIPFLSKVGMIKTTRLAVADWATASKDLKTGSYSFLNQHGDIPDDRHQHTFYRIANLVSISPRESFGENIACESFRENVKYDLFYQGQTLFHLFCSENRTNYVMKYKLFDTQEWIVLKSLVN
jgi:hypothetical protein